MIDLLQSAAKVWSEQRIPETRRACLWQGHQLQEAERWAADHVGSVAPDSVERAFLDACVANERQPLRPVSNGSRHPRLPVPSAFPARRDDMLNCDGGGDVALSVAWPWGTREISSEQYQRWVELSYSLLLVVVLCLAISF